MRELVQFIERDGQKFYYIDVGWGCHGKKFFRLWISSKLVEKDEEGREWVTVTGKGRRIIKTEKGNFVLKPDHEYNVFNIGWKCGYRGDSFYEILNKEVIEIELPYQIWDSPLGRIGISDYALVSTKSDRVAVNLRRTGRTYGEPKRKVVEYYINEKGEQAERELPPACFEDTELASLLKE